MADRSEENLPVPAGTVTTVPSPGGGAHPDRHLIYKPGEGYWIRVMTLAMIALITLTSAGWAYKALEAITIPAKAWDLVLRGFGGTPGEGQAVTLMSAKSSTTGEAAQIGTAHVLSFISNVGGESVVRISNPSLSGAQSVMDVENQTITVGTQPALVSSVRAVPAFDIEYVQIGVAALLVAVGVWVAYWFVGRSRYAVEFLIATDSEMRKVNWSTRREIMGSTYVVIGACLIIALSLFVIDYAFSHVFIKIDLLRLSR